MFKKLSGLLNSIINAKNERIGFITRDISLSECPWLKKPIKKGTTVCDYVSNHFGMVQEGFTAVMLDGYDYFIELNKDVINWCEPSTRFIKKRLSEVA